MKKPVNQKNIFIIIIIIIFLIIATSIYNYLHSATLIIQVAPTNAIVSISGREYKNGIFNTAPKKQVTATISAEGFEPKTITLPLEKNKVNKLLAYLTPADGTWSYYEDTSSQESLSILLTNLGYQSWDLFKTNPNLTTDQDNSAEILVKKLSIKSHTPIQFSVCGVPATRANCDSISINYDYSSKCNDSLCLVISGRRPTFTKETKNLVESKITEIGFNPSNYHYIYQQVDN